MNRNTAIIVAGGSGKRLPGGKKKQFIHIAGIPILIHAIHPFIVSPAVHHLVIVLPENEIEMGRKLIKSAFTADLHKDITFVQGGANRQDSVLCGLQACPEETDFVLIHDGVRPFVSKTLVNRLLKEAGKSGAAIPVTPVRYTLKEVESDMIVKTIPRQKLFEAHTPQVFDYSLILELHRKVQDSGLEFTDDASILEHFGKAVTVVTCDETNIKITRPTDLILAEKIYEMIHRKENS